MIPLTGNRLVQEQLTLHRNCLSYLQTKKELTRAQNRLKKRQKKENKNELEIPLATSSIIDERQQSPLPPSKASDANPMTPIICLKNQRVLQLEIYTIKIFAFGVWSLMTVLKRKKSLRNFFAWNKRKHGVTFARARHI